MPRRSTKFYRRNEAELMSELGFKPTINSGAGWIEKEDGQNDYLIAQLKSTDKASLPIHMRDIQVLELNAATAHKVPVFVLQFLQTNDVFVFCRPSNLPAVCEFMATGKCDKQDDPIIDVTETSVQPTTKVKSAPNSRSKFWEEKAERSERKWKRK